MKKTIVLLLAVLYVTITSGVMVNIHYCMGEIASVGYGHEKEDACGKCGMEETEGCCHTEHQLIKTDDDHLFAKGLKELTSWNAEIPAYSTIQPSDYGCSTIDQASFLYDTPPDKRNSSLCIYNSVFRI